MVEAVDEVDPVLIPAAGANPTTIAFAAPGVRHAARVLMGQMSHTEAMGTGASGAGDVERRLGSLLANDFHQKMSQHDLVELTAAGQMFGECFAFQKSNLGKR